MRDRTMASWGILQLMLVLLVSAARAQADEVDEAHTVTLPEPEFHLFVSQWDECGIRIDGITPLESDGLVHTPLIGVQEREVKCHNISQIAVDPIHCKHIWNQVLRSRTCIPDLDCIPGDWSEWRPRADGSLVRNRQVKRLPQGKGENCFRLEEIKPLVPDPTAHWAPGPWGPCKVANEGSPNTEAENMNLYDGEDNVVASYDEDPSDYAEAIPTASCGGGTQRRAATCVNSTGQPLHPSQCSYTPLPTLVQPCEEPCPRDCEVGEWGEWSPCEPTDGCPLFPVQELTSTGYSVRRRRISVAASGGGALCPPLEEKRSCATPRCASWQALPWGPCVLMQHHKVCGRGRRTRELRCVGHDGKDAQQAWCSGSSAPARTERCRIACAGDCVVSAWGPWSPCSAPCTSPGRAPPTRKRERHILAHPASTGWPCPSPEQLVQHEMCNTHACATYSWLTTPWGPCETNHPDDDTYSANYTELLDGDALKESEEEEPCIEEGEMTRDVMCVQNNADVVRDALCAPLRRPTSRRACTIRCHRGCRVEAWGPWSSCPNTCEPTKQIRVRSVHGGEGCGSPQQSRDCPIPKSCQAEKLRWHTSTWSECLLPPGDVCGYGYNIRSLWCGTDAYHRVDAGMCVGITLPRTTSNCFTSCTKNVKPTCDLICKYPFSNFDMSDPNPPNCTCDKTVRTEIFPSTSNCILPKGAKCGPGRALDAVRCIVDDASYEKNITAPIMLCRKYLPKPIKIGDVIYKYDNEFPDLVQRDCIVDCPKDCVAGPWGEWGPCAAEAGSLAAFRFRTREIIEEGTAGGRECGATLQRSTCEVVEPQWKIGEWSVCSVKSGICGGSIVNRTITCVDDSGNKLDKLSCENISPMPPKEAACRAPCPIDCFVSAWSEWSPCEQSKWGGRRDRTRVVLRPAAPGGASCGQLVEATACAPHIYSWHIAPWEDCQPLGGSPCGEGIKQRAVRCLRSDGVFVKDSFCPNATFIEPRESWCYVPCGVDCELSEWSEWDKSACACDVRDKHMHRSRQLLTASVWPGRACGEMEQKAPCPFNPCIQLISRETQHCHILAAPAHVPHVPEACGWGSIIFKNTCEVTRRGSTVFALDAYRCPQKFPGQIVHSALHYQDVPCQIPCGCSGKRAVKVGPWSHWSNCHFGTKYRSRKMLTPYQPSNCRASPKHVTIEWVNCTEVDLEAVRLAEESLVQIRRLNRNMMYQDGYIEGSTTLLAIVWSATLIVTSYGAFMLYRGMTRCARSRRLKTITKV